VYTDNGDVREQGHATPGPEATGAWRSHQIHAPLVARVGLDVRVTQQAFRPNTVPSFAEDLAPRAEGRGMAPVNEASSCASTTVVAKGIERSAAGRAFALLVFRHDGQT